MNCIRYSGALTTTLEAALHNRSLNSRISAATSALFKEWPRVRDAYFGKAASYRVRLISLLSRYPEQRQHAILEALYKNVKTNLKPMWRRSGKNPAVRLDPACLWGIGKSFSITVLLSDLRPTTIIK